jgi:hypothetical protein
LQTDKPKESSCPILKSSKGQCTNLAFQESSGNFSIKNARVAYIASIRQRTLKQIFPKNCLFLCAATDGDSSIQVQHMKNKYPCDKEKGKLGSSLGSPIISSLLVRAL